MTLWIIVVIVCGYLVGCFHGSSFAQRISGINLKSVGSNNAGASNATVVLGKKFGALVAAIDIGKGAIAILVIRWIATYNNLSASTIVLLLFLVGFATILGHNYPFHMKFNGGKGTATIIGVLLTLDWKIGLIGFALFIIVTLLTDYIAIGALVLNAMFLVIALLTGYPWNILVAILLLIVAISKHLENFKRIKDGTEKRVSEVFKKKQQESSD